MERIATLVMLCLSILSLSGCMSGFSLSLSVPVEPLISLHTGPLTIRLETRSRYLTDPANKRNYNPAMTKSLSISSLFRNTMTGKGFLTNMVV